MTDAASSRERRASARKDSPDASPQTSPHLSSSRRAEVLRVAKDLFKQKPEWVIFFREILGVGGAASRVFPLPEERAAFEQTAEYAEIQRMLAVLRTQSPRPSDLEDREPTRVITVRLPKSMHEALRNEASSRQTSINKLCIAKLLQALDEPLEPTGEEQQRREE